MSTPTPVPPTPPEPDTPPLPDPDVRDSDPNAGSRHGLGGDMGVSSERVPDDPGSIEGTGSRGTATERANGIWSTFQSEGTSVDPAEGLLPPAEAGSPPAEEAP